MCTAGFGLLVICFFISYIFPIRIAIDLNLARNVQYLLFLLLGFSTLFFFDFAEENPWYYVLPVAVLVSLFKFSGGILLAAAAGILMLLIFKKSFEITRAAVRIPVLIFSAGAFLLCGYFIARQLWLTKFYAPLILSFKIIIVLLSLTALALFWMKSQKRRVILARLLIIIPLFCYFIQFVHFCRERVTLENTGGGFWVLQRSWEDMQKYVKLNTPKSSLLLVPHNMEMGGFRILSERKIICSYRDCGIIGFDYQTALEWYTRLKDIETFEVMMKQPPTQAIKNAILKYRANYIVFMNYAAPKGASDLLTPVYANEHFSLYRVNVNPAL